MLGARLRSGYCNGSEPWCPGTYILTQDMCTVNLSPRQIRGFLAPGSPAVGPAFDYSVIHTDSGSPSLAKAMLEVDGLDAIEVSPDPDGPSIEEQILPWNRILEEQCLHIRDRVTQRQSINVAPERSGPRRASPTQLSRLR